MLPGKLCIGILEEDNPLKSYFRLKPLLLENEGKYEVFDGGDIYPEDGCIRIVPDKNESSHFKARMRRMGKYCVLDLREHTGENDKIRPNKNYHGDETERNAHIVYSDVVREPAPDMIFEIADFDGEGEWQGAAPGTMRILQPQSTQTWRFTPGEDENSPASIAPDGEKLNEEELQRFEIPGFPGETLRLAVRLPGVMPSVIGVPAPREKVQAPAQEMPKERPAAAPVEIKAEPAPEKPWISHDMPQQLPQPVHGRMSPLEQAMAAQSGLNPRRNRSLQEIIEEKWRHSRVDQLGHPVPAEAMGKPVEDPVERVVAAIRSAWENPEIHGQLLNTLAGMGEFSSALDARKRSASEAALRRELEDLEAERLKSLDALDKLRRDKQALRETFKQEIRLEEADALKDAVEKTKAAQEECKKYEAAAEEARKAAEFAKDAFEALNDGRFEERLREYALNSRAAEILAHPLPQEVKAPETKLEALSRDAWIQRVMLSFAAEGLEMDEVQAANLLVCAVLGDSMIFSGPAASDKWIAAKAFARALGENTVEVRDELPEDFAAQDDAPAIALVRDANRAPYDDLVRTAGDVLVISTVSDAGTGFPLNAELLERSFMIRLEPVSENAPWQPKKADAPCFPAAGMASLKEAFLGHEAELPCALERRLQKIRSALAVHGVRLSRRTLDCMWHYCAAMIGLNRISPAEALDRAFAQKALPCILAEAPVVCLAELKSLLAEMPRSQALLNQPLPILI